MKFTAPFLKLPVHFSADRLAAEVRALPPRAWLPHPQGFAGNEAVPLVSPHGELTNAFDGPMAPTEHLLACPYMLDVMRSLGAAWGRGRLMALAPGADVPSHVDFNYYWRTHYRVHIPVITNPGVQFTCDGETVHMQAGECWIPDTFKRHTVRNGGSQQRIHLVLDTVGGERFWDLMSAAQTGGSVAPRHSAGDEELAFEQMVAPAVMSPYEVKYHLGFLVAHLVPHAQVPLVTHRLDKFVAGWTANWARFGTDAAGLPAYRKLIDEVRRDLGEICGTAVTLDNGKTFFFFFEKLVLANAISRQMNERSEAHSPPAFKRAATR